MESLEKIIEARSINITTQDIKDFEKKLLNFPQVNIEVTHRFLDGMYSREVFMKKGTLLTSKTHKTENLSIISKGTVIEVTESKNIRKIEAPFTMTSKAGTKRALYILEDTVWTTVHYNPTNEKDLSKLEDMIIESDLEMTPEVEK